MEIAEKEVLNLKVQKLENQSCFTSFIGFIITILDQTIGTNQLRFTPLLDKLDKKYQTNFSQYQKKNEENKMPRIIIEYKQNIQD